MAMLINRLEEPAQPTQAIEQDGPRDPKVSPAPRGNGKGRSAKPPAPADTLRTLAARLQAQLDSADMDSDPEARMVLRSVRRRLKQVNEALARVEEGKYGICADCDKPIENDRLVLQPVATRCTGCQTIAEWRGYA